MLSLILNRDSGTEILIHFITFNLNEEEISSMKKNGNITRQRRCGLVGNMLTSVCDSASRYSYAGATDFDGMPGENPLTYNASGSLVSDAGRGIARIDYDRLNNPVRIQFTNGSVTRYVYSTAGEKLRVIHQTAVPNITVPIGSVRELARRRS